VKIKVNNSVWLEVEYVSVTASVFELESVAKPKGLRLEWPPTVWFKLFVWVEQTAGEINPPPTFQTLNCLKYHTVDDTDNVVYVDGHSEVVHLLLDAGADVNVYDSLLVTPLHLAALGLFTAHFAVVSCLATFLTRISVINNINISHFHLYLNWQQKLQYSVYSKHQEW